MAFAALKSKINLRIGANLAVMQGIGVMLVVGMIANAIYGNSTSRPPTTRRERSRLWRST